ncbi:MAG: hypothetical protein A4E53_04574 [Pelotomaculum sp. PtaB.Bin104]|nr:MAG: hypothetical protein A4E53_04574 [Pelotomaculum sp. PtaB.Bin104]
MKKLREGAAAKINRVAVARLSVTSDRIVAVFFHQNKRLWEATCAKWVDAGYRGRQTIICRSNFAPAFPLRFSNASLKLVKANMVCCLL